MEQVPVTVEERPETLKPEAKSLRRQGLIPAVVYHKGDSTVAVTLGESDLHRVLHSEAGRNALITLTIKDKKGDKTRTVVVKDIQFHPISGKALNVDFHQISLTEKIKVLVQVIERGEAVGVKTEDGVLEFPMRELEIECLPTDIPENIEVDVSNLHVHDSIYVRDLSAPSNVTVLSDPEAVVVHVVPPRVEKPAAEVGEEVTEPEVIGEEKEEAEGAEEKPAEAAPEGEKKAEKKPEKK